MRNPERKPLVVAVDDDRDFLEAIRQMLTPAFRVECFSGPAGLPEAAEGLEPDLLLLDLHMPDVDGVGLCKRFRAQPRFADLPVLFLTASKADEDFVRGLRVGADGYLNKPIGAAELRRRVKDALKGRPAAGIGSPF